MGEGTDFFVSHAGADRAWAEWVAWQLTEAGYTVELDLWDWAAGQNFVTAMSDALDRCERVVALFSAAYFDRSRYTADEWTAAALHLPSRGDNRLVPLRLEDVPVMQVPPMLRPLVFGDLFGVGEEQARQILLRAVAGPRRPDREPLFPGHGTPGGMSRLDRPGPRLPGSMPRVWNIPARNPAFTGRDGMLAQVRERLLAGDTAVVQAFQGMGGVGKSQLAIEYAHRFAAMYDLAWWVNSEQAGLIGDQFAALGTALGCVQPGAGMEVARVAVLAELRERGRWLLIFDNIENPADVRPWLPVGGHVLITSRERGWAEIAVPVEVDVLARPESVVILRDRVAALSGADADQLASQLGDLPLAITQAAGFMAETGTSASEYLELLRTQAGQLLDQATPGSSYPRSLAAATCLIADRLDGEDPAAAQLASLCAFLAPELIPAYLFTGAVTELPHELATRAADSLPWRQTLGYLARQSLAQVDQRGLQLHRLTQAILRDRLTAAQAAATRVCTEAILAASNPADQENPATWPQWAQLMPHLLAADLAATDNPGLRQLACDACSYLMARGDTRAAYDLATDLRQRWRQRLGDDHEHTLAIAHGLGWALQAMGRYTEAHDLAQDTLERSRRVLGFDHPLTLATAHGLAIDLRSMSEMQAACDLAQDTLDRYRRVLGEDDPSTLSCASNLAADLYLMGEAQAARDLAQATLDRSRRVLGGDHPSTLSCAGYMAAALSALGEVQAACDLAQDTLDRRRRVLGADHPSTLVSALNLAADLRDLGEVRAAHDLDQDTLERSRRVLGDHPRTRLASRHLAEDLRLLGEVGDEP